MYTYDSDLNDSNSDDETYVPQIELSGDDDAVLMSGVVMMIYPWFNLLNQRKIKRLTMAKTKGKRISTKFLTLSREKMRKHLTHIELPIAH